ncbi:MAG: O-antigen polysaccharide polymerase Wzy, partial [Terriglobia bacterium]
SIFSPRRFRVENRRSLIAAHLMIAAVAAGLLIWVFDQPERYLECAAGVALIGLTGAVIVLEHLWTGKRPIDIKDLLLTSYALFLGGGMVSDSLRPDSHFDGTVIVLAYGGLFCFLLGFMLHAGAGARRTALKPAFSLHTNQLFKVSLLFFALGCGFLLLEWKLYGRVESYLLLTAANSHSSDLPKPYVTEFTELAGPGLLLALILLRRGTTLFRRCILTCFSTLTVTWYMFRGVRTSFAWLAMGFLLVWSEIPDRRGSRRLGPKPFLFASFAMAAMLALSVLRTNWNISQARAGGFSGLEHQVRASLDTFYQFRRTFEYFPSHAPFLAGYSFYGIAVNPIPRSLWPGKPIGVGLLASILYDHNSHNTLGLSLPGELYANFGIPGLLFGMFLFGVLAAAVYRWYERQQGDPCALVIYILLTGYMWFGIRGDMLDAAAPCLYQLAPVALCFAWLTALNSRSSGVAQTSGFEVCGF